MASKKNDVSEMLKELDKRGIDSILALRGDKVPGIEPKKEFIHAVDLISFIRRETGDKFKIYAACYPEGHTESNDFDEDINFLKQKVDAGVDGLISQLFFDNNFFFYFIEKIRRAGINVPVEAGIMPVTNKKQIEKMVNICGASLPVKFRKILDKYGDNPDALKDAGIIYASEQIADLLARDADGIHLYVMNNVYVAHKIDDAIKNLL